MSAKCRNLWRLAVAAIAATVHAAHAHDPAKLSGSQVQLEEVLIQADDARAALMASPVAPQGTRDAAESFYSTTYKWDRSRLSVCFWQVRPEDQALLDAVMAAADEWTVRGNVAFDFLDGGSPRLCRDHGSADIRVTLDPLDTRFYTAGDAPDWDWARYGKAAHQSPALVSMSLVHARPDFLSQLTSDFHFLVAHEFGHALGLLHEHQRLDCASMLADDATVMAVYGWTRASDVAIFKANLVRIQLGDATLHSSVVGGFDQKSITFYNFPQGIWKKLPSGTPNPCARAQDVEFPSTGDLDGIAAMYPLPSAGAAPPPADIAAAPPPPATREVAFARLRNQAAATALRTRLHVDELVHAGAGTALPPGLHGLLPTDPVLRETAIRSQLQPSVQAADADLATVQKLHDLLARAEALAAQ